MDDDFIRAGMPEILAFSLNLPIQDLLHVKSGGIQKDRTNGPYELPADAMRGSLAQFVGIVGEEKILRVEKAKRGFEVERLILPSVMWREAEHSGRERGGCTR